MEPETDINKATIFSELGTDLGKIEVGDYVRFDRGENRTVPNRYNIRRVVRIFESKGVPKLELVNINNAGDLSAIQVATVRKGKGYTVSNSLLANWTNYYEKAQKTDRADRSSAKSATFAELYGMSDHLIDAGSYGYISKQLEGRALRAKNPCSEISLVGFPRHHGKSAYQGLWADFMMKQDFSIGFKTTDTIRGNTAQLVGIDAMENSGNLENPITKVRQTLVNGQDITGMTDRQLIGAINNFNNQITELESVDVNSVAIRKHVKRLGKAINVVANELDKRAS